MNSVNSQQEDRQDKHLNYKSLIRKCTLSSILFWTRFLMEIKKAVGVPEFSRSVGRCTRKIPSGQKPA